MFTASDLAARFGVAKTTIFRWREDGTLPAPLMMGKAVIRWREQDIELFEQWLLTRANLEEIGGNPDSVPKPEYSLPISTDPFSMARERLAASYESPSKKLSQVEELERELNKLTAEAAIIASKSRPGQLKESSIQHLRNNLSDEVREILLEKLPSANAERLQEILEV